MHMNLAQSDGSLSGPKQTLNLSSSSSAAARAKQCETLPQSLWAGPSVRYSTSGRSVHVMRGYERITEGYRQTADTQGTTHPASWCCQSAQLAWSHHGTMKMDEVYSEDPLPGYIAQQGLIR